MLHAVPGTLTSARLVRLCQHPTRNANQQLEAFPNLTNIKTQSLNFGIHENHTGRNLGSFLNFEGSVRNSSSTLAQILTSSIPIRSGLAETK